MEKKNYYGILPAKVRYDKNLRPMEKILYAELTTLTKNKGYCFANNEYFAKLYDVNKKTVSLWLNNLVKYKYLKTEFISNKDGAEERRLYLLNDPLSTKKRSTPLQKNGYPLPKIMEHNNTNINNNKYNNNLTTTEYDIDICSSSEIVKILEENKIGEKTISNISKLKNITLEKIQLVLEIAKEKSWGEGAIYTALKEKWTLEKKPKLENTELDSDKEKWLKYFSGLDKESLVEIKKIIHFIPIEVLNSNRSKLSKMSIFDFKKQLIFLKNSNN